MDTDKRADNLSYNKRKIINTLDNEIYENKKKINGLSKIQESLISLDFYINDCVDLLAKSMKSEKDSAIYSDMQESNKKNLFNSLDIIENNIEVLKKNIDNLREEKDEKLKNDDYSEVNDDKKSYDTDTLL